MSHDIIYAIDNPIANLAEYQAIITALQRCQVLLLYGKMLSIPKKRLISDTLSYLICLNQYQYSACLHCSSCILYAKYGYSHPDIYLLEPLDGNKHITMEQISHLINFIQLSVHSAAKKIIIIESASWLTINTSNALLKILEEPPSYCVFIIQAVHLHELLPTVLSRCFRYNLTDIVERIDLNQHSKYIDFWLIYIKVMNHDKILLVDDKLEVVLTYLTHPTMDNLFICAAQLDNDELICCDIICYYLQDILSILSGCSHVHYFTLLQSHTAQLATTIDYIKLFALYDHVVMLESMQQHRLNYALQLENILIKYQQLYSSPRLNLEQ